MQVHQDKKLAKTTNLLIIFRLLIIFEEYFGDFDERVRIAIYQQNLSCNYRHIFSNCAVYQVKYLMSIPSLQEE